MEDVLSSLFSTGEKVGGKYYRGSGFSWIESVALNIEGAARLVGDSLEGQEARDDELALHFCPHHNGVVVEAGGKQIIGKQLGRETRYAGIANDDRFRGQPYGLRYRLCRLRGRLPDVSLRCAHNENDTRGSNIQLRM